ncbi:MAG: (Fe-S)-binding protein, partial [Hyphomicrobiaceae bacterium]
LPIYDLLPEMGFKPTNKYLPPRPRAVVSGAAPPTAERISTPDGSAAERLFAWIDKALSA